jgi:hypothetical protein
VNVLKLMERCPIFSVPHVVFTTRLEFVIALKFGIVAFLGCS